MTTTRDTPRHWNGATIVLHWLSAALVAVLLALGFFMVYANLASAAKFDLYQMHKSLGFVALALLLIRIAVRLSTRAPAPMPNLSRLTTAASTIVHISLYILLSVEALTGWLFVSSSIIPIPTRFFRLFSIPNLVGPDPALSSRMATLHLAIAWIVTMLILGHVLAALKHHLIDRDDVLRRIVSPR